MNQGGPPRPQTATIAAGTYGTKTANTFVVTIESTETHITERLFSSFGTVETTNPTRYQCGYNNVKIRFPSTTQRDSARRR
jgi:hypothetical protein